ncbi:hypothetical protein J1N35_020292 [Gossypium stocksii]|uniref:MATE efflux family protein n=1 Tax=Gossypium stocksii TaxID=47602 RepID=A0A9D3VCI7_9ROSI|nr:hypothetical protein J1N35_020292 [Gossypium stocksii]
MENQNLNNPIIFFRVIQKKMEREDDQKSSLTSALIQIPPENEAVPSNGINGVSRKKIIWEEVKKQVWLAGPLIGVSLFQYSIQMISVMLVGHLGELPLSAASMATSFATVTGFSLLTWTGFSKEAFHNIFTFLRLAVPSAIMVCLEMWSFEMMVLLSGLLPNPKLQTSVLSICHNTSYTVWMIPFGLSGAVSTRVSNELGAGNAEAARLAVNVVIVEAICVGLSVGSILILIRNIWGHAYSNEVEVDKYVAVMMPLIATSNFLDSLQCVLSGNARGCGWQKIGAYINLGSYYIVGIPCAVLLAFVLNVGGKGLWLGLICALAAQATGLSIATIRTNWEIEVR